MAIDPKVYLKAYERLEREDNFYCCVAMTKATFIELKEKAAYEVLKQFSEYFKPAEPTYELWWGVATPEAQSARKLALLFMYEIAKDLKKNGKRIKTV